MRFFKKREPKPANDGRLRSVGIIMDGNGRWAKARGLSRSMGHVAGARIVEKTLSVLSEYGVKTVTLYAFSTENWNRPKAEVDGLMELFYTYLSGEVAERIRKSRELSVRFIGDKSRLPEKLRSAMLELEEISKDRPFVCNFAINYGARAEIVRAVNSILSEGTKEISEADLASHLYTADCPDPDLIIRTGGEKRISNFLLWQSAYSELVFTDVLWPDFDRHEIERCLNEFFRRKRRYGAIEETKDGESKKK